MLLQLFAEANVKWVAPDSSWSITTREGIPVLLDSAKGIPPNDTPKCEEGPVSNVGLNWGSEKEITKSRCPH